MDGLVFDIQRCSLHDGPGIRTTVFLKGCPLHCQWCHNPESIGFAPELSFNPERCLLCGACVQTCPNGAHQLLEGVHTLDRSRCQSCGLCAERCPAEALRLIGKRMSVEQVLTEVLKDRAFYTRSGGGLTLSGGEPTAQFAFTLALLKTARAEGLHTCLETSGVSTAERYERLRPLVDVFLFDYKVTDPVLHRHLVGVDNVLILENLDRLYQAGAAIILRCPLIPGLNDQDSHLKAIAALAQRYPRLIKIELMAYHTMGVSKAAHIGHTSALTGLAPASEEVQLAWLTRLQTLGCTSAVIS